MSIQIGQSLLHYHFLLVGVDECSIYESSWGTDSYGEERNGTTPSNLCGVTTKLPAEPCR